MKPHLLNGAAQASTSTVGGTGELPPSVSIEVGPTDLGIGIKLEDTNGNKLIGALSPHQARELAAQLVAIADQGSEPKCLTVLVVTPLEAWIPGQMMLIQRSGPHLQSAFKAPWRDDQKKPSILEVPKPKLIVPGR